MIDMEPISDWEEPCCQMCSASAPEYCNANRVREMAARIRELEGQRALWVKVAKDLADEGAAAMIDTEALLKLADEALAAHEEQRLWFEEAHGPAINDLRSRFRRLVDLDVPELAQAVRDLAARIRELEAKIVRLNELLFAYESVRAPHP